MTNGMVRASTYVHAARQLRDQFYETHTQITALVNQNLQQVKDLEQRAHLALGDLTVAIMPTLSEESLERAVQLTGQNLVGRF